jgi:hypothetical protein
MDGVDMVDEETGEVCLTDRLASAAYRTASVREYRPP